MVNEDLVAYAKPVLEAKSYIDVFTSDENEYGRNYRFYARNLHPDNWMEPEDKDYAQAAFQIFTQLADTAAAASMNGTYGELPALELHSKTATHTYKEQDAVSGDVAQNFLGETDGSNTFLKIAPTAGVNDLLRAEANALRKIDACDEIDELRAFYPTLLDSFKVQDRQVNVLGRLEGFYTVQELREKFPYGLNVLDWTWMWRRILIALGGAHKAGLVHGAVLPEHVLIHPEAHGLVLVDWCYSKPLGEPLTAMSRRRSSFYAPEVAEKKPADQATDIYMAVQTMNLLLRGTDVPRPIRSFLNGSSMQMQSRRPMDAFVLLAEFDELLQRIGDPFHPRRFRQFVVN